MWTVYFSISLLCTSTIHIGGVHTSVLRCGSAPIFVGIYFIDSRTPLDDSTLEWIVKKKRK